MFSSHVGHQYFHVMCENIRTMSYVCTVEFIKFERFKIESLKNWNLGSSLRFSEVISLVMLNIEKSHFVIKKRCMHFTVG